MAQSGYTPIQLYYSPTATNVPLAANLAAGELAINTADEKLYFKNASGTVKLLASSASASIAPGGSNTQVQFNSSGSFAGSANLTFNGTTLTAAALTSTGVATFSAGTVSAPAITTAGDTNTGIFFPAADTIAFTEGGVESMRIDSSGNVGIGTSSPVTKLHLLTASATAVALRAGNSVSYAEFQVDASGNSQLIAPGGVQIFNTNGAERMRIDSSGDVGIGAASNGAKLYVQENQAAYSYFDFENSTNGGGIVWRQITRNIANTGTASVDLARLIGGGFIINNNDTNVANYTAFGIGGSERMRIDSSGNVGIGTSSPQVNLDVNSADAVQIRARATTNGVDLRLHALGLSGNAGIVGTYSNHPVVIYTNTSERMRISSAGGLSVGTTADPGAGAIYATGNITAYYSDERLKNISGRIENALSKVNYLSGVYYTNNEVANANGYTSTEIQVGVLAQQVKDVLPEIVKPAPFDLDSEGNSKSGENYMTVQYERLVPLLIEAIKELTAKVEALEAK